MKIHLRWLAAAVTAGALIAGGIIVAVAVQDASASIPAERACQDMADKHQDGASGTPWTEGRYRSAKAVFERTDNEAVRQAGINLTEVVWAAEQAGDDAALAYLTPLITTYGELAAACAEVGAPLPSLSEVSE